MSAMNGTIHGPLRVGSFCSGICASELAWRDLGWQPVFFSEIEPSAIAVEQHHFPAVPNLGDMRRVYYLLSKGGKRISQGRATEGLRRQHAELRSTINGIDVLVAGTPCQAFSVAGNRRSLDDDRGNLTLIFTRLVHELDPAIVVWENVPGCLSTDDNAFGCFLAGLVGEGQPLVCRDNRWPDAGMAIGPRRSAAWRILDAQYFRLAQRRRRVFVVSLRVRDGINPGAILLEPESVHRDSPPRREAGQDVTGCLAPRTHGGGGLGTNFEADGGLTTGEPQTFRMRGFGDYSSSSSSSSLKQRDNKDATDLIVGALQASTPAHGHAMTTQQAAEVCPTLQGAGAGATSDMRPCVVVPVDSNGLQGYNSCDYGTTNQANTVEILLGVRREVGEEAFQEWGLGVASAFQSEEVLQREVHGAELRQAASKSGCQLGDSTLPREEVGATRPMRGLRKAKRKRCRPPRWKLPEQLASEFAAYMSLLSQQEAQTTKALCDLWKASEGLGVLQQALDSLPQVRRSAGVQDSHSAEMQSMRGTGQLHGIVREALYANEAGKIDRLSSGRISEGSSGVSMAVRRLTPV